MKKLLLVLMVLISTGVAKSELIAHWKFDENSGNIVSDSQSNHDGTINGASWDSGKLGTSLLFNNDYVNIGNYSTLQDFSQLTLSAWIYCTGAPKSGANYDFLAGKEMVYKIDIDSSHIRFLTGNDWGGSILTSNTTLTNNTWYHIAAVYDGEEKRLFINGTQDLSTVSASGAIGERDYAFTMGAQPNSSGYFEDYYRGKMDDVRVYNNALTQSEIQSIMIPEPATLLLLAIGAVCVRQKPR